MGRNRPEADIRKNNSLSPTDVMRTTEERERWRMTLVPWTESSYECGSAGSAESEEDVMRRRDIVRLGLVGGASLSVSALVRAHEPPVRIGALIPCPTTADFLRPCGTACGPWLGRGKRLYPSGPSS